MSVLSVIKLTEEMFGANYITVLTGKFNQDTIEVIISYFRLYKYIMQQIHIHDFFRSFFRIVSCIDDTPTSYSLNQIFRIISLYTVASGRLR